MNSDPDRQPPFLSYGFRPFFLFAGLYAVAVITVWVAWLELHDVRGVLIVPTFAGPPHLWHGHEMIYGFAAAVLSGFMLTAVPSWTGARRIAGWPLALLAAVWLTARAAMWFSAYLPPLAVAVIDLAHLPLLAAYVAAGLMVRPAPRNLVFIAFLLLLALANAAYHAEIIGWSDDTASPALAFAILVLALMVTIIGGRIVPSFTRNVLNRANAAPGSLPRSFPWLDRLAIVSIAILAALRPFDPGDALLGAIALIAAAANLARLWSWRWQSTLGAPILWSLHLSYLLLAAGLADLGFAYMTGKVSVTSAMHLLSIGGIAGMTLAVMTRASLGHTGRPLQTAPAIGLAYGLLAAAAVVRAWGVELVSGHYVTMLAVAGGLWIAAFGLFAVIYFPILTGPSLRP